MAASFTEAADFTTHYYLHGQPIEPPPSTQDEEADIAAYEDFILQSELIVETRCTADGSYVHASAPGGQGKACTQGHRWEHEPTYSYANGTQLHVGWTWRQVP